MGAMIYAKQPLSDDALAMLPGVKIGVSDILRMVSHLSLALTPSFISITSRLKTMFLQVLPELSAVQDRGHYERQLVVLFENSGIIQAPLRYVQLGLFNHRECRYSGYCQIHCPSSHLISVSILGGLLRVMPMEAVQ